MTDLDRLSIRQGARLTGLSYEGFRRWRAGTLRLSPEREGRVLAALRRQQRHAASQEYYARRGRETYKLMLEVQ